MSDPPASDRPPEAPQSAADAAPGGPVMSLLARGLELWLRQQCEAIERLEIRLEGSGLRLLRGRLDGVRLRARRVVYQAIEIEEVELRCDGIQVRLGSLVRNQAVQLEQPFRIQGLVSFSGEGLSRSFSTPAWRSLGDGLADDLLGLTPLAGLRISEDRLLLRAFASGDREPVEREVAVRADGGTVELRCAEGDPYARLPMDPNIRIERAELGAGLLHLEGEARVSP
ncbi:LmeA family phospholipid-binding protein [Synechococcus sp. BA-132 BA5]|uniref:LmeA family phospholipid-binding protein n=1 Tax=Synechococcus sp. BA-132 BA5 TaxID=3110252 RepID=UPI002B1F4D3E|nr:DUF2993 domain-containing protein [Synechococcus sp. BA-132 BA5]MEA5415413.1 DUF2993 domain-containing protein [Synechococcus sp. BA-132 BA5]